MTLLVNVCWLALAALHVMPSAAVFAPKLVSRLYGVDPAGDVGLLLRHRAAQFVGVIVACTWALVDAHSRRLASALVAVSMISFLLLYWAAGRRERALARIARADLIGLAPLLIAIYSAWQSEP